MVYLGRTKRIHFVGIGGIGMSGIAEVLLNLGFVVSGSDLRKSEITDGLEKRGAIISIGHDAENVRAEFAGFLRQVVAQLRPLRVRRVQRVCEVAPAHLEAIGTDHHFQHRGKPNLDERSLAHSTTAAVTE